MDAPIATRAASAEGPGVGHVTPEPAHVRPPVTGTVLLLASIGATLGFFAALVVIGFVRGNASAGWAWLRDPMVMGVAAPIGALIGMMVVPLVATMRRPLSAGISIAVTTAGSLGGALAGHVALHAALLGALTGGVVAAGAIGIIGRRSRSLTGT